ncbi:GFA family protein [Vibrio sp. SS-MA-C1-2]|uniref:GFA family protein n=1 Tax=Vibrio sp. SS-MA-C1-2 TaxID=2908646 RepID=UPI001F1F7701|nr:GFA family protein [Vibrio sp. SS-MA-C1-2]UJF17263.1 GFA family protein [Vibrio sp. SS-MA-C1-2]
MEQKLKIVNEAEMTDFPIQASCQCGQVSFSITAKPKKAVACHCQECQKLSTSAFSVTAIFDASNIEFKGNLKEWSRIAESGNINTAVFCPDCGNRVYHYNPAQKESIKLKLKPTGLSDDEIFAPQAHVWTSEKLSWYKLPTDIPCFEKMPV